MNILKTLSVSEMIELLRQRSAEFKKKADDLENMMLDLGIGEDGIVSPPPQQMKYRRELGVSDVATVLRKKRAGRPQEIANALGVSKQHVLRVVQSNPEMFETHGKGWIKLRHNGATETNEES